jgi:hypothetical protein
MADAPLIFGPWEPDKAPHMSPALVTADNVLPVGGAYAPFPAHVPVTGAVLPSYAYGLYTGLLNDGSPLVYGATKTKIYRIRNGTVDQLYDAGAILLANWWILQFEGEIIAGNSSVQPVTGAPGAAMALLSADAPAARIGAVVERNYVMLGDITSDGIDGRCPNRVRWSGFRNGRQWGTNVGTGADFEDMVDEGGQVVAITGRGTNTVFQRRAITRFQLGGSTVFDFTTAEQGRGPISTGAVCDIGSLAFYRADDGFFAWDGTQSIPIGTDRVDRWFHEAVEHSALDRIVSGYDPISRCVLWAFPETGETAPTKIIAYSLADQRFTSASVAVQQLGASATLPTPLEFAPTPDDPATGSFDDAIYAGRRPVLAGIDDSNRYGTFSGDPLAATLETGDWQAAPGQRAFVNGVRPIVDSAAATVAIGHRPQRPSDALVWQGATSQGVDGLCPQRIDARYMRHRMSIPANDDWTRAVGLEVSKIKSGGRR